MRVNAFNPYIQYGYIASDNFPKIQKEEVLQKDAEHSTSEKKSREEELSPHQKHFISYLQKSDATVKAHEMAHRMVGGALVGPASFSYVKGPDERMYAVAGDVLIDTSEGSTPRTTITKADQIVQTALAPVDPSGQDLRVASSAAMMRLKAQLQLRDELSDAQIAYAIKTYQDAMAS